MQGFVMRGIGVQWFQRWQTGAGPTAHDGRDATCPPSLPPGWAGNPGDLSLYQEGGASSEEGGTLSHPASSLHIATNPRRCLYCCRCFPPISC